VRRRWIFWLLVIIFLCVVVSRLTEIEKLAQTLIQGQWEWILIAAALQVLYYVTVAAAYQAAFWTVEVKSRLAELLPVTFAALFINVAAPSANVSGMALWADDASRRGESPARATAGVLLFLIGDLITFTLVLFVGMEYLFSHRNLQTYELIGAALLVLMVTGLTGILAIGLWRPAYLHRILIWLKGIVNGFARRLKRYEFLKEGWAERNAAEFADASSAIARYPFRLARMLGILLASHLVDLASLYAIFLAFHNPVTPGVLVAGYAIGILFWIVSPTPQGIGVVEGVMPLVFASQGVPAAVATAVSLSFRGLTFWLPLWIGFVVLRRVRTFGPRERSISESWFVRVFAILTATLGLVNVLSGVTPSMRDRVAILEEYSPLSVRHGGRLTVVLAGFALILLARGLWRRKRVAWLATLVILLISVVSHLVKGLDYEEAFLAGGLAIWLLVLRDHFHARSDRPSIQQGLGVLVLAFFFTLGYGVLGFFLLDRHYTVNFGFFQALRQTVVMFTQFYDPGLQPITGFGRYFAASIYVVGLVTFGYAGWMIMRPVFVRDPATPEERSKAAKIVENFGRSSLARLTLLNDKAYYFSPGGTVIAYTVKGRIAVTLGDPIGPEEDFSAAVKGFGDLCEQNDWNPAFAQILPETLPMYREKGFEAICVGYDAIVEVKDFTLEGGANKPMRTAFNRLTRGGYQVQFNQPPISDEMLHELRDISDEWLTMVHGTEKRFSLGWFDNEYIRSCPIAAVRGPEGWITAFTNVITEYQHNEISIDLMRRRREVEPGTMDFLFIALIEWAKSQNYDTLNLGLSALSGVGQHPGDPAIERMMHFIYENFNQFYNFKGLHEFKDKFHPHWSPRYLVYPSQVDLPAVWWALVQAISGEPNFPFGYLKRPKYS
jgi:phosphatidylglycerol lysyltransferase